MKNIPVVLFVGILTAAVVQGAYEENEIVQEMVASGNPVITHSAPECPRSWDHPDYTDRLGSDIYSRHCVRQLELPREVMDEVLEMEMAQLDNQSDYDARVTKFYIFEQTAVGTRINEKMVRDLAKRLGIPKSQTEEIMFKSYIADEKSFDHLVIVARNWKDDYVNPSETAKFLRDFMIGELVLEISLDSFVALYPGGGLGVTHRIYIIKGHLIYIKHVGWDA